MGFFSQDCRECGESVISPYDMPAGMEWQNEAVAITPHGSVLIGPYDGYGRIEYAPNIDMDDDRFDIGEDNTVFHRWCWEQAGKPTEYRGPSEGSSDQGYFYDRSQARVAGPVRS